MAAKLYSGGGEVVAHSSESASHGSAGARRTAELAPTKFHSVSSVPTAKTNEAMLMTRFSPSQPSPES